ncbi:hypothetical protein QZH41_019422 [Actinostola sp. cb2023]|nr:hypothetical protein QZH41_019422 [Actinostola sp. cb2023]
MEPVIGFLGDEEFTDDYDESKLPCSGLEYLRRVQLEALECPDVVVADVSRKKFAHKQTVDVESNDMPIPTGSTPSYKWQMQQAADFADIRQLCRVTKMCVLFQEGTPPLSSILFRMKQVTVQQVLEYHVNWFEQGEYSHIQGRWLYSLLACLVKPLLPETIALLRTLARLCARYRMKEVEHTSDTNELTVSLNLIIALVTRYFGQTDLADPG